MADRDIDDALARSFLAELPPELAGRLRANGERADYPAGTTVSRAGAAPQTALVVSGLLRVYLMSVAGRASRVLRDLRVAGIVASAADSVVILDAASRFVARCVPPTLQAGVTSG